MGTLSSTANTVIMVQTIDMAIVTIGRTHVSLTARGRDSGESAA
jgi:hypothetical protein